MMIQKFSVNVLVIDLSVLIGYFLNIYMYMYRLLKVYVCVWCKMDIMDCNKFFDGGKIVV